MPSFDPSLANLKQLAEMKIYALIADNGMRQRDERFVDQDKFKAKPHPLHDKRAAKPASKFGPKDFNHDPATNTCICPAGQALYSNGKNCTANGRVHHKFQGAKRAANFRRRWRHSRQFPFPLNSVK